MTQNKFYIEYLNKNKNFAKDKKYFSTYENALKFLQNNFDKYNIDMIKANTTQN
jgi:hypothetical protein